MEEDQSQSDLEKLKALYPELYENVYCGYSCRRGWFDIISLCSSLFQHEISQSQKYRGLKEIQVKVAQIKEKFGHLRFYYDVLEPEDWDETSTEEQKKELEALRNKLWGISETIESMSALICEDCSSTKEVVSSTNEMFIEKITKERIYGGWIRTLCGECRKKSIEENLKRRKEVQERFKELENIKE